METADFKNAQEENFDHQEEPFTESEESWTLSEEVSDSDDEMNDIISSSTILPRKRRCIESQKLNFKCPEENCKAVYRKKWLLDDHIRKHYKLRPFRCNIGKCEKSFTKEPHLKRHKIMVHESVCEQICDVKSCGLVYNNKYSLKKHKNQVHNASKWPFFCNECSVGYKKKWQLNQHNYKHTGEPPFKCTTCNIGFTIQRDLTKHNRNHRTYTCDCGETFEKWSLLRSHKKSCSAKEEHLCTVCNKKFIRKENLVAHLATHEEREKMFPCPYIDCSRSYQYKKNLKFHISFFHEKHLQKEIPCPECGKIFLQQFLLNRHVKIMHNNIPKIKKPVAPRKDKGKSRTFTAAPLAGFKLSQKDHIELLKNPEKVECFIVLTNMHLPESGKKKSTESNQSVGSKLVEETNLIEQNNSTIDDSILNNFGDTVEKKVLLSKGLKKHDIMVSQNQIPIIHDDSSEEHNAQMSCDEIIQQCSLVLNKIEECLA